MSPQTAVTRKAAALAARNRKRNALFKSLTPSERRVAIAQEVLRLHSSALIVAETGTYLEYYPDLPPQESADAIADGLITEKCHLCQIGSAILGAAVLFDQLPSDTDSLIELVDSRNDHLDRFFTEGQQCLMEIAFEKCDNMFRGYDAVNDGQVSDALEFGRRYTSDSDRLVAIWQNVIRNDGEFVPTDTREGPDA